MGILESARGVMWARRRQPDEVAYAVSLAHERFSPPELIEQAVAAENAGFDAVCCSDHLAPWWPPKPATLAHCGGSREKAASMLGISMATLYRKVEPKKK